ncbi:MAG: phospholipase D-like domain-containing protein [Nitrososphaerota archaeon]
MYTIYPIVRRLFFSRETGYSIFAVRLDDKPLAVVRFLEDAEVRYYVDTIEFSPRNIFMYRRPVLFLKQGLGMRLTGIHALELEFVPENLRKLILSILSQQNTLARWILLKYNLFKENGGEIREKKGFQAFDKMLEQVVQNVVQKGLSSFQRSHLWRRLQSPDLSDEEFLQFGEFVLLHSLSHVLKNSLETYVGCNTDDLQYFLEHPKNPSIRPQSERVRVIIFEDAVGGLGYLKTLAQSIKVDHQEYRRFIRHLRRTLESYQKHLRRIEGQGSMITANLSPFRSRHAHLVEAIEYAYSMLERTGIYPHVNSVREVLADRVVSDEDRARLDDMLSYTPLCWDGCQLCVILERGCSFINYDQPFLVSCRLTIKGLETIVNSLEDPKQFRHFVRGIKDTFYNFIKAARSHIYITTPWISKNIVDDLLIKANAGVRIRLLVSDDTSNYAHSESLNYLRQVIAQYSRVEVRLCPSEEIFVHAKGVMVDDCMLLEGSFNLTNNGLKESIENVIVSFTSHDALDFARGFNQLWEQGSNIVKEG